MQKGFDLHFTAGLIHPVAGLPAKNSQKKQKKCRWNDRWLRVLKSTGSGVGLPLLKSGETHDQNCDPTFDPCDVCRCDGGRTHGQHCQGGRW
jgi:hypothetical protein